MKLLGHLCIYRGRGDFCQIELYSGDLTLPHDLPIADALIVSAFRNDYRATEQSLIGALAAHANVSVAKLAESKAHDYVEAYDWWLSEALPAEVIARIRARQIFCFEPENTTDVSTRHRFLAALISSANIEKIHSVTMPIILSGDRGADRLKTLELLLREIQVAFEEGVNLREVRIVELPDRGPDAEQVFSRWKQDYLPLQFESVQPESFDVFLSYCHQNKSLVCKVEQVLKGLDLKVFRDEHEFKDGDLIPMRIRQAIHGSRMVMPFISHAYASSPWCRFEFQAAYARRLFTGLVQPKVIPLLIEKDAAVHRFSDVMYKECFPADEDKAARLARDVAETYLLASKVAPLN